jgi:CxxH/CxxC protein (TIGR04129 family)
VFVVCAEHLEEAIDEFVEVYEAGPDVYLVAETPFTEWTAPSHCHYCEEKPIFLVV